ncbi:hypothetical protein LTR78_002539 [Recurvomyces mirabilis]|uniref:Uncharacterized protein n=1 Tax=Recurvomyces mirabilis TaxID=574656 RepID=A0AAE0WTE6_9PEZI|nr:hypothetical protein LTR78_002539 [Recurvomyces mirabilis]KAK5157468.1 hypothetical protein LTS14_004233 [Recurvomyces mirabilis]
MAITNEYSIARVSSTCVKSANEQSVLVEAGGFAPIEYFLKHSASGIATQEDDTEPPRKRQKLRQQKTKAAHTAYSQSKDDRIPIHKVIIDLVFPQSLQGSSVSSQAIQQDADFKGAKAIDVVPYGIDPEDDSDVLMRFTLAEPSSPVLIVEATDVAKAAQDALRLYALPGAIRATLNGTRDDMHPASVVRCTLTRSLGQLHTVVRLEVTVSWRSGVSAFPQGVPVGKSRVYDDYDLLAGAYPDASRNDIDHNQPWSPQDFYESVHVPPKDGDTQGLWNTVEDAEGNTCYVNFLQATISREPLNQTNLSGGLLAEEMGLGKTVELMALIASHRDEGHQAKSMFDALSGMTVTASKATLIITPPSIMQQWKSELARHAPALRVHQYRGIPAGRQKPAAQQQVIDDLCSEYDVVLATYSTLAHEVHFAEDPPDRDMRHARKFERKRSPLVQIRWWRVCLDEAQMVESGVTAAARVACRLPRVHSWAVTGTPLRKNVQDLHGLLIFLQYQPLSESNKLWSHLITNHRHRFRRIWGDIALRHTKAYIRDELRLPPQKRIVLSVPFSTVEQQHYATMFEDMCNAVGLEADGSPVHPSWDPENSLTIEAMRSWLVRLRQTCLHPQVGGKNRKALGRGKGPLRTVAEVLETMIEQNETMIRTEERVLVGTHLSRAHILGNNGEDAHRSEKALGIYKAAVETSEALVREARQRLAAAKASIAMKGELVVDTEDEESSSESTPLLGQLRGHLRTALQLQHACTFFAATATYQIKSNEALTMSESEDFAKLEEQESNMYDAAKQIRRELLLESSRKAESTIRKIKDNKVIKLPTIKALEMVGIEGRKLVDKSDDLFDVIRKLGSQITAMRKKMAEYLIKPLVDEEKDGQETTGDEYENSTKEQDELYVYFDVVKAMHADLNTFVTGEDAPLIDHEMKTLVRDAMWYLDPEIETDSVVHAPELLLKLVETRNKLRQRRNEVGSVRGLIQQARGLEGAVEWKDNIRAELERTVIQQHLTALQKVFNDYTKTLTGLEKEVDLYRTAQNQRLEFYRQLQELSDAVAPYKDELDAILDLPALEDVMEKEEAQEKTLAQHKTKNRFLVHLRDDNQGQENSRICVICRCDFESGVLTVCGHQYCKECIHHWWHQHRTCPVCKRRLHRVDFHDITYKPQELKAQEEVQSSSSSPGGEGSPSASSIQSSIYSDVDSKLMNEIKSIDLPSSYGTKIDTLGRHLLWIREHDPGAKSIVFSQYREFLDVLGTALQDFKIGFSRVGQAGTIERFRHDPSVDCLLLDAKTDSSGLTLVNATHVFICEPLIQTAVELQAIARVHRIGQTRPTTVWMYLVNDTVEEAIYEISVNRRLAHVQSRQQQQRHGKSRSTTPAPLQETALDAANSEELQTAPLSKLLVSGKGGGEVVGKDDLWQCLFGKARKNEGVVQNSVEVEREMGRHLRAEAAVERRGGAAS